jgi:hypothetical protein
MSKAEIIAQLPHLSAEDRAEVRAKLDELAGAGNGSHDLATSRATSHIRTPRHADPRQAAAFRKQVVELPADAAL